MMCLSDREVWIIVLMFCQKTSSKLPSGCVYNERGQGVLDCSDVSYVFPDTFDVETIPAGVKELNLGRYGKHVLKQNITSVPARGNMTVVSLYGFTRRNTGPFALEKFLADAKHSIIYLTLESGYLPVLKKETLSGFSALVELAIHDMNLEDLAPDALSELQGLPDEPRLRMFEIKWNNIRSLEWTTFKPVASSLRLLHLKNNKIQNIFVTEVFHLDFLYSLALDGNLLTSLRSSLFRTLNQNTLGVFDFRSNPTCPDDRHCGCCETLKIASLLSEFKATAAHFNCGPGECCNGDEMRPQTYDDTNVTDLIVLNLNAIDHCKQANSTDDWSLGWSTAATQQSTSAAHLPHLDPSTDATAITDSDASAEGFTSPKVSLLPDIPASPKSGGFLLYVMPPVGAVGGIVTGMALWRIRCRKGRDSYSGIPKELRSKWEIPKRRIRVDRSQRLGIGHSSRVYCGTLGTSSSHVGTSLTVALKCFKTKSLEALRQSKLEIRIAAKLDRHANLVRFYGITSLDGICIVMEYCSHGSLLSFLRASRSAIRTTEARSNPDQEQPSDIAVTDLARFAYEICRGMSHVSSYEIVHRDLAARNVLLARNMTAKICDFGMARQGEEYVLERTDVALPLRWLALESILSKRFSTKSDVWSYGIVVWEIFTLGDRPYETNTDDLVAFVRLLDNGLRLARPALADGLVWELCLSCWQRNPEERPCFADLEKQLELTQLSAHQPCCTSSDHDIKEASNNQLEHVTLGEFCVKSDV